MCQLCCTAHSDYPGKEEANFNSQISAVIHLSQHDGPEMSLLFFTLPLPIERSPQHYFKVKMQDRFVDISPFCLVSNNSQTLLK